MLTGHAGLAAILRSFSGKTASPAAFVALAIAAYSPDIMDVLFFAFQLCSPYGLYTHTVPSVVLQAALICGLAWLVWGSASMTALFALVVLLHVPADYLTGWKLFQPGAEYLRGLVFYRRPVIDCVIELGLVLPGWFLLRRTGYAPKWTRSAKILVPAVVLQVLFAYFNSRGAVNLKGGVCFSQPPMAAPY